MTAANFVRVESDAPDPEMTLTTGSVEDTTGLECLYCLCTDVAACNVDGEACHWVSTDPPVCSNPACVERHDFVTAGGVQEASATLDLMAVLKESIAERASTASEQLLEISLDNIEPDPTQARDEGADDSIGDTLTPSDVLPAIEVRVHPEHGGGKDLSDVFGLPQYMIIDGERRWRGSKKAGRTHIRAWVNLNPGDDGDRLLRQAVLNEGQRLKPMEEARTWKRIMTAKGYNIKQLADAVRKPKSTVSDRLALLDVPKALLPHFERGVLTAAAAPIVRQLATLPTRALDRVVAAIEEDYNFEDAVADFHTTGKAVRVDEFEQIVDQALTDELAVMDPKLDVDYKGKTVQVGNRTFAIDADAYRAAAKKATTKPAEKLRVDPAEAKRREEERKRSQRAAADREKEKAARDTKMRLWRAQFSAVAAKLPGAIDGKLALVLVGVFKDMGWVSDEGLALIGVPVPAKSAGFSNRRLMDYAAKLDTKGRIQLLLKLAIWSEQPPYRVEQDHVGAAAKALNVDLKKVKLPPTAPAVTTSTTAKKTVTSSPAKKKARR